MTDVETPSCKSCRAQFPEDRLVCPGCGGYRSAVPPLLWKLEQYRVKFSSQVWRTREKEHIHVRDMDDGHLLNTLKLHVRNSWKNRAKCIAKYVKNKDGLPLSVFEETYASLLRTTWEDFAFPFFYVMLVEAERRGLGFGVNEAHEYFTQWKRGGYTTGANNVSRTTKEGRQQGR